MPSSPNDSDAGELLPRSGKPVVTNLPHSSKPTTYQLGSVESSTPLENSVSLEEPKFVYRVPFSPSSSPPAEHQRAIQQNDGTSDSFSLGSNISPQSTQVIDEMIIPLLEERLIVDRNKRKVGEVVVRKEIETYIVEVPVRREKLIVEQVSPDYKQLAVVDLGQPQEQKINHLANHLDNSSPSSVSANFTSVNDAVEFLKAIAIHPGSGSTNIQVSLVMMDRNMQTAYQNWLEQHST